MLSFKGYLHRFLAVATQVAPFTAGKLRPVLESSAKAAVEQCTGGESGRSCGFYWAEGEYVEPESSGVGEQMNVLAAVSSLLITDADAPVTKETTTSGGDGADGSDGSDNSGGSSTGGSEASGTGSSSASTSTRPSGASRAEIGVMMAAIVGGAVSWLWI